MPDKRTTRLILTAIVVFALSGCASTPDPYDVAWDACIVTYDATPVVIQNGDAITVLSPEESCTSYIDMVGETSFIETWTDDAWVMKHRDQLRLLAELKEQR